MVEEQATVIRTKDQYVWVQTERQSSCGHCSVKSGCGTQVLSKVLGNKLSQVRCLNPLINSKGSISKEYAFKLQSGDRVVIGLEETALIRGSMLIYFLPLVSMIVLGGFSVFIGKIFWPQGIDVLSIIFSFTGLILGLRFTQTLLHKNKQKNSKLDVQQAFEPVVLKKISHYDTTPIKVVTP
ncbi:MAG: SoxR reducing system RseC family protein [Gammaproteobacteria bacterium]|nr:SoxR reducing system RseC family protein [Gammaproteobacteria bacterium]